MKRIIEWIKSPKSDRALFIIALILLNLVCSRAYLRFDLTRSRTFSLSPASRLMVRTLREPLSVRVYFSGNLPARYAQVQQYLSDLMVEYKGAANKNFAYSFVDMRKADKESEAQSYGLRPMQIQEVKNNEIGFKSGYMGLVITYMDEVDIIDGITSTASLEYNITSKIGSMIQKADALSALGEGEKITLTLYLTDELKPFNIAGFDGIEGVVSKAAAEADKQGRLSYHKVSPPMEEMEELRDKYGVQLISWQKTDGSVGMGVLGLVVETPDGRAKLVPLTMERGLFGYGIAGLDEAEASIKQCITSLMSKVTKVAYITGHGEADINQDDMQPFVSLTSDMYSLEETDLTERDIGSDVGAILINGPKTPFSAAELYKIDQAVMRGVNAMFLIDPFDEDPGWGGAPSYTPIDTGISKLLTSYGAAVNTDYVMDEDCYVSMTQEYGEVKLYPAPLLQGKQLSKTSPITRNLANVLFYETASVDISAAASKGVKADVLAASSPNSWSMKEHITLNPLMLSPPQDGKQKYDLAVMMEGRFKSAFDSAPKVEADAKEENEGSNSIESKDSSAGGNAKANGKGGGAADALTLSAHKGQSTMPSRIFVSGTSQITKRQLIDPQGAEPIAVFMRNAFDYVCGNEELCSMRTKGLSLNTLHDRDTMLAIAAKFFNQYGIAILSVIAALIMWRKREKRRRQIHDKYNPFDTRVGSGAKDAAAPHTSNGK